LYLETGQGIEEMLAISLEPDIAIETFHDYVQIRGLIILQGECKKAMKDEKETEAKDSTITNYIEKIIDTEPGQAMFSHRFPVEISVPKERIKNMADVKVEVVNFDYEIPSTQLLKIDATLHIHGIIADELVREAEKEAQLEKSKTPAKAEQSKKEKREPVQDEQEEESLAQVLEQDETDQKTPNKEVKDMTEPPKKSQEISVDNTKEAEQQETEKADDALSTKIQKNEPESGQKSEPAPQPAPELQPEPEPQPESVIEKGSTTEEEIIDIQLSESETDEDEEQVKDVLFLTDLFGGISEESVTTMRIHIIQEDDTVESIAKRYDMSTLQLLKENQLTADEMTPGKLIYIENKEA